MTDGERLTVLKIQMTLYEVLGFMISVKTIDLKSTVDTVHLA